MNQPEPSQQPSATPDRVDDPDPQELWKWAAAAARPHVGWIFIGAGALLILLGYLGVSRESIVGKQLPFLISGGIGGILLAVIGAYFLGTEELRRDSGRLNRVEQQVADLHAALLSRPDAPVIPATSTNGSYPTVTSVVVVEGGETFHRSGCQLAAGKEARELEASLATADGLSPCPVCEPVAAH